jgi:hypothetical protein
MPGSPLRLERKTHTDPGGSVNGLATPGFMNTGDIQLLAPTALRFLVLQEASSAHELRLFFLKQVNNLGTTESK